MDDSLKEFVVNYKVMSHFIFRKRKIKNGT